MSSAPTHQQPEDDDDFVADGSWGEIRHVVRSSGRMEAKEWMDAATDLQRSKFDHLFRKMAAVGRIVNEEHFRKLRDEIWEFKRDGDRILCFRHGNCWRLTHHYPKSGKKCPKSEIDRADEIRLEFLASLNQGEKS